MKRAVFIGIALMVAAVAVGTSKHSPLTKPQVPKPTEQAARYIYAPEPTRPPTRRRATAYPLSFTAGIAHSNLHAMFDANIDHAQQGNAYSMLLIAEVTEACAPIGGFASWDEYAAADPLLQSGQMPREMQDEFKAIFDRLSPECSYVNAHAPERGQYSQWAGDWYKRAAAAGSVAARLRMLSVEPPSEDNRQSMALLLNDVVDPTDYRLDYIASTFLMKYPVSDDFTLAATWRYAGCLHDPECDAAAMRDELIAQYLPAQVDDIVGAARHPLEMDFLSNSAFEP